MSYFSFDYSWFFQTYKKSVFCPELQTLTQSTAKLLLQKSTSFSFKIFDQKIIKALVNIVEEQSSPQQDISTDSNRLKCFTSKSKLWDYPRLNFDDYLSP